MKASSIMTATTTETTLTRILRQECDAFQKFSTLLERECQALAAGTPDALLAIVNDKDIATETLQRLARERDQCLGQLGLNPNDRQSVNGWFNQRPAEDALRQAWEALIDIGRRVNEQNISNGKMIVQRLESTQESLYALRKAASGSSLYGPDGKMQNPFGKGYPF